MKKKIFYIIFFSVFVIIFSHKSILADDPSEFNYIGVIACGKCHKSEKQGKQLKIWQESIHAQAFNVLNTKEAAKICSELGYEQTPAETSECLICHASGIEVDTSRLEKGFNIEDGIQCETCHGAGSGYKSIKIMKNRELAIQNGLINVFENTEEYCRTCHNPDSPTFAGFNFEEMWKKIEHSITAKNKEK